MGIQIQTKKDYQILSRLGQGLSSDLYKCIRRDPESNFQQIVTLKQYKSDIFRKKFHNELENLSRINCEGIPKVLDWSYEADRLTIVTEYVDGCDLHQFIQLSQSHDLEVSTNLQQYIINATFQSLKALHEAGICHGDLKPSNILLSVDGKVKIIDICLGDHGLIYATPEFSAPEVLAGNRPDFRSDLYSLGLIAQALEMDGYNELLQIKPGLRRYKRSKSVNPGKAISELSAHVWKIKYEFDSCDQDHKSLRLNRKPIDQVAMNTIEYQAPLNTLEYQTTSIQEPTDLPSNQLAKVILGKYRSLKALALQKIRFIGAGVCLILVVSSQAQLPLLGISTIRFRSLKALEVWDAGRWNTIPYDIKVSLESPQTLSFKLRTHNKISKINVEATPYKSEIVEIDAL